MFPHHELSLVAEVEDNGAAQGSSTFKPLMIPSSPAQSPTSDQLLRSIPRPTPFFGQHVQCSVEPSTYHAPHERIMTAVRWQCLHRLPSKTMLGCSEGALLDSSLHAMQQEYCKAHAPTAQMQISSQDLCRPSQDRLTAHSNTLSMQQPHQFKASYLGQGLLSVSGPERSSLMPTAQEDAIRCGHVADVEPVFGKGGDHMYECTVRGGRALQAQFLLDPRRSISQPVKSCLNPSGDSATVRSGVQILFAAVVCLSVGLCQQPFCAKMSHYFFAVVCHFYTWSA
jgi:hypothetical protein